MGWKVHAHFHPPYPQVGAGSGNPASTGIDIRRVRTRQWMTSDRFFPYRRDRQKRPCYATGSPTTPQSGHQRPSRRPCTRWPTACLLCDFEFRSIRMIGPNGVRTRWQASILGTVAMSEGVEDDNRPPVRSGLVAFVRAVVVSPDLSTHSPKTTRGIFDVVVFVESCRLRRIFEGDRIGMCCRLRTEPDRVRSYDDTAHEGDKI
jgi:hypothetical protein